MNEIVEHAGWMIYRPSLRIEQIPSSPSEIKSMLRLGAGDEKSLATTFQALRNRQDTYGVPLKGKVAGKKLVAYWSITDIFADHLKKCSMLRDDMLCGIYESRPLICKTVPMSDIPRGKFLERSLNDFVTTKGYECDTSQSSPMIVQDGKIKDQILRDSRAAMSGGRPDEDLSWIPVATRESLSHVEDFLGTNISIMVDMFRNGSMGSGFGAPFAVMLAGMVVSGKISEDDFRAILQQQTEACSLALERLSKSDFLDKPSPPESWVYTRSYDPSTWRQYINAVKNNSQDMMNWAF